MVAPAGPWGWLCGWCSRCCRCRSPCLRCACCACPCACVPLLCPPPEERLRVHEVSASDYIDAQRIRKSRIRRDTALKAALRSCGAFCAGLSLTMAYALIVLFIMSYNLWFCLISTIAIGFFLALGMAFSMRVRITALLMLPETFSSEAKTITLFVAFALLLRGPTANIIENGKRTSLAMGCGAQMVLNETKEILLMVTKPIMSALKTLENFGSKIRERSGGIFTFFHNMITGAKDVGDVIRRVWSFLATIGDVCNEEMERPYHNCINLFEEAKDNCLKIMSFMGFLCYILDAFKPLCGLAKIVVLACIIPNYIQNRVRENVKNPVVVAALNFQEQFDFNITILDDGLQMNFSIFRVAIDVIKDFREDAWFYAEIFHMFGYSMFFVCVYTYVQALRYRRNYLTDLTYDNIYITRDFIELDVMRAKQRRPTLLPLSSGEGYDYIRPASLSLTKKEKIGYAFAIFNVVRSLLLAILIVLVDYHFFYMLDYVDHLMKGAVVARAPSILSLLVNGTGVAEEIYATLVSAFDSLQPSNLTVDIKKCQIIPKEPDYIQYVLIASMHGFAFMIAVMGIYMQRLRRYICACYYPTHEQVRICFLYNQMMTRRTYLEKALYLSIRFNKADKGHSNILLILAAKCPLLFGWLAKFLVATEYHCMGCAQAISSKYCEDYLECSTFGCKGKYCGGCSEILNNTCTLCMAPLVYNESDSEEIDSSDDEQLALWIEAMKSIKKHDRSKRKKMKIVIKGHLKERIKRGAGNEELIQKYKESTMSSDSEETSGLSDVDAGDDSQESDFEYQSAKVTDEFYQSWFPTMTRKEDDVFLSPAADVQDTTGGGRRNREVERGLIDK